MKKILTILLMIIILNLFAKYDEILKLLEDVRIHDQKKNNILANQLLAECINLKYENPKDANRIYSMRCAREYFEECWVILNLVELKKYETALEGLSMLEELMSKDDNGRFNYERISLLCDFHINGKIKLNKVKEFEKKLNEKASPIQLTTVIYLYFYSGDTKNAYRIINEEKKRKVFSVSTFDAMLDFEQESYSEVINFFMSKLKEFEEMNDRLAQYGYFNSVKTEDIGCLVEEMQVYIWLSLSHYKLGNTAQAKEYFGKFKQNYHKLYEGDEFKADYAEFLPPAPGLLPSQKVYNTLNQMVREFEGKE